MMRLRGCGGISEGDTMKLWLISQSVNDDYDTYDSAVVAAASEDAARKIHPGGSLYEPWPNDNTLTTWAGTPNDVTVREIGEAHASLSAGIVCASFNAG